MPRPLPRSLAAVAHASTALALLLAASRPAHADEATPSPVARYPEPKPQEGFAGYVAVGGAIDRAAAAAIVGVRYRFSTRWITGADVEWNPWFNNGTPSYKNGVINGHATLIRQYPMKYEPLNLRTTFNIGTSVLMQDLVGAPAGKPGLFVAISPLGIEWRLQRGLYLVFDPVHIVIPAPQMTGIPFAYPQYRTVVGLEFG